MTALYYQTDDDRRAEDICRKLIMSLEPSERFLMGLRMCETTRMTVLASLPDGQSPIERKVAVLRRYYQNDFSEAELVRIEQSLRASDSVAP